MRLSSVLLTIIVGMNAQAESRHTIIPHVGGDGRVTWIATIDATTAYGWVHSATSDNGSDRPYDNLPLAALNRWLDDRLSAVGWCSYGWYYLTEDPNYINTLPDGQLASRADAERLHRKGSKECTLRKAKWS
jgi:hypothetical protein